MTDGLERAASASGAAPDDKTLAYLMRFAQWALDEAATNLPVGRLQPDRLRELVRGLEQVTALLAARAGVHGETAGEVTADDELAAGLTLMTIRLSRAAPAVQVGQFPQAERLKLADAMQDLVIDLRGEEGT